MSLSFSDMWDLIQENHSPTVFSCELLVGIFWEETMFTNRKQLQGPAVGFGQVEPATMKAVNAYYGTNYSVSLILIDDPTSVGCHERCFEHVQRQRTISLRCSECLCGRQRASSKQKEGTTVAGLRTHSKERRYR